MPNPNAVVATSFALRRQGEERGGVAMESVAAVELDDGRVVRLPGDGRSAGIARVLEGLAAQGRPVYLEIDPETDEITRVEVPYVTRVVRVRQRAEGLDVELDASHARHVVRADADDADELARTLREAAERGTPVILTDDDSHQVIHVRDLPPELAGMLPPFGPAPFPEPPRPWPWWLWWWRWIWELLLWPLRWWFRCLSPARAQEVFDAMSATTCDPLTVTPPCIPFMYPDDGCWGRAHEMARLMIGMGLSPRKVWIDASSSGILHVATRNHPDCYVEWFWHVAPTLCVRSWMPFTTRRMVFDPSLFTTPVTEATWKGVQNDPAATLTDTSADVFWHGGGTDPTYSASNGVLATYRSALHARAVSSVGPPPYAGCP